MLASAKQLSIVKSEFLSNFDVDEIKRKASEGYPTLKENDPSKMTQDDAKLISETLNSKNATEGEIKIVREIL